MPRGGKIAGRRRRNPTSAANADIEKALRGFEAFTGEPAEYLDKLRLQVPRTAWALGPIASIDYIATVEGKTFRFQHEFDEDSRPLLASSSDGKQLLILGGGYAVTERGIVDH